MRVNGATLLVMAVLVTAIHALDGGAKLQIQ